MHLFTSSLTVALLLLLAVPTLQQAPTPVQSAQFVSPEQSPLPSMPVHVPSQSSSNASAPNHHTTPFPIHHAETPPAGMTQPSATAAPSPTIVTDETPLSVETPYVPSTQAVAATPKLGAPSAPVALSLTVTVTSTPIPSTLSEAPESHVEPPSKSPSTIPSEVSTPSTAPPSHTGGPARQYRPQPSKPPPLGAEDASLFAPTIHTQPSTATEHDVPIVSTPSLTTDSHESSISASAPTTSSKKEHASPSKSNPTHHAEVTPCVSPSSSSDSHSSPEIQETPSSVSSSPTHSAPTTPLSDKESTHASTSPSPIIRPTPPSKPSEPLEPVFISLKEWKRRKLQDMQARARAIPTPQKPIGQRSSARLIRDGICQLPRRTIRIFFSRRCKRQIPPSRTAVPRNSVPATLPPTKLPETCSARPSALPAPAIPDTYTLVSAAATAAASMADLPPSCSVTMKASISPNWVGATLSTRLALRSMGHFVQSIKQASSAVAMSPPAAIYNSLLLSAARLAGIPTPAEYTESTNGYDNAAISNVSNTTRKAHCTDSPEPSPYNLYRKLRQERVRRARESGMFSWLSIINQGKLGKTGGEKVKEKPFNYASADAGARVLASSGGTVGAKNVIQGNVDKYLLTPCDSVDAMGARWIEIELSEEVILESVQIANFEYYSSSPRRVAILGSNSYPPSRWNLLGVFEFSDVRIVQRFSVERRAVTRYLRAMFAGKHGHEYYCPISTIRAFGKNLIADWKDVFDGPGGGKADVNHVKDRGAGKVSNSKTKTGRSVRGSSEIHSSPGPAISYSAQAERIVDGNESSMSGKPDSTGKPQQFVKRRDGALSEHNGDIKDEDNASVKGKARQDISASPTLQVGGTLNVDSDKAHDADAGQTDEMLSSDGKSTGLEDGLSYSPEVTEDESSASGMEADGMSEDDRVVLEAVRSDTLSPVSGDDNIFRKVTRMIKLLELNQTLTNQYIDTQLERYARALSNLHDKSEDIRREHDGRSEGFDTQLGGLESRLNELRIALWWRDAILGGLVLVIGVLVGTHWILWTALSGAGVHATAERVVGGAVHGGAAGSGRPPAWSSNGVDGDRNSSSTNGLSREDRSVSSVELSTGSTRVSRAAALDALLARAGGD